MKNVSFHPDAEREMNSAAGYYELQQANLGRRFLVSIQNSINHILLDPCCYPIIDSNVRRSLIKNFPYGIIFMKKGSRLVIIAIMHLRRDPDYWKSRMNADEQ